MNDPNVLSAQGLGKQLGGRPVLRDISFAVLRG